METLVVAGIGLVAVAFIVYKGWQQVKGSGNCGCGNSDCCKTKAKAKDCDCSK